MLRSWSADIGDHVAAGQVLRNHRDPGTRRRHFLRCQGHIEGALRRTRGCERGARSQFATQHRCAPDGADSPEGVVSEQEREDKKAGQATPARTRCGARAGESAPQADVARARRVRGIQTRHRAYAGTVTERRHRHRQSRHGGKRDQHHAPLSHGQRRPSARVCRCPAERQRCLDEGRRTGANHHERQTRAHY